MAKQTFTAGQVLTATQMNNLQANDYNWSTNAQTASYVLVAADAGKTITMTSASATTITVNNSLFAAGDRVQVINLGAGTCTITAGTATVNSASSLALVQYQSGTIWFSTASAAIFIPDDKTVASGLTLISTTTIGTAVSSVTVSNAFSSTYDNYLIEVSASASSAASGYLLMTLGGSAGSTYSWGASTTNFAANSADAQNNTTSWKVGQLGSTSFGAQISLQSPGLAKYTTIQFGGTSDVNGIWGVGVDKNAAASTAFTLTPASGTITGGTIKVYGYVNS